MNIFSFIKRKILRISRDRWNYQYQQGQWQGLAQEQARFQAVVALLRTYTQNPSILEVGCGEALLLKQLQVSDYKNFTGIDLSDVAIEKVQKFNNQSVSFVATDMEIYQPTQRFDAIIFTESLYYAKNPAQLLARYAHYLNPNGIFIISAVQNKYTVKLWDSLGRHWQIIATDRVENNSICWDIKVLKVHV